ncbi:MAG: leucine-rich repeat domain-containing protein [Maioricimonas sp. JB045]
MSSTTHDTSNDRSRNAASRSNLMIAVIVVLLLLVPVAWIGTDAWQQHRRLERLRSMRARYNTERHGSAWVHDLLMTRLGPHYAESVRDVVSLVFERRPLSVDDVRWLHEFPRLTALHLLDVGLTDAHLAPLSHMTQLRALALKGTGITDRGFEQLAPLTNLRQIMLRDSQLTGDALKHLSGLTSLDTLTIEADRLGKDGIGHLAGLPALHRLELHYAPGSTVDLELLHRLPALTSLTLETDTLPPGTIDHIAKVTSLRGLTLIGPEVTDEDLRTLQSMPDLKRLAMYRVVVSQEAVDAFRQARPDCRLEGKRRRVSGRSPAP